MSVWRTSRVFLFIWCIGMAVGGIYEVYCHRSFLRVTAAFVFVNIHLSLAGITAYDLYKGRSKK